jgi:hypothetical protein
MRPLQDFSGRCSSANAWHWEGDSRGHRCSSQGREDVGRYTSAGDSQAPFCNPLHPAPSHVLLDIVFKHSSCNGDPRVAGIYLAEAADFGNAELVTGHMPSLPAAATNECPSVCFIVAPRGERLRLCAFRLPLCPLLLCSRLMSSPSTTPRTIQPSSGPS